MSPVTPQQSSADKSLGCDYCVRICRISFTGNNEEKSVAGGSETEPQIGDDCGAVGSGTPAGPAAYVCGETGAC